MHSLYERYSRLSPWYQVGIIGLYFGLAMAVFAGAVVGNLIVAFAAFVFGLVIGLARQCSQLRRKAPAGEIMDEYPLELDRVERRHVGRAMILGPAVLFACIAASWVAFGTGLYGAAIGFPAAAGALWALARFGGPDDPKWREVKDEWRRQHPGEAA